jgi:tetratricopeptide (TPR) repeat protein
MRLQFPTRIMTRVVPLLTSTLLCGISLHAVESQPPTPAATLPPSARPLQLEKTTGGTDTTQNAQGHVAILPELAALQRAVQRVQKNITEAQEIAPPRITNEQSLLGAFDEKQTGIKKIISPRFGERSLSLSVTSSDEMYVSAAIDREPVESIYRELAELLGRNIDDTGVIANRRPVSLHVKHMAWGEALDRLLGQAGLSWRDDGGTQGVLVIYDTAVRQHDSEQLDALTKRALIYASHEQHNATGAEALYWLGKQHAATRRPLEAMNIYSQLADGFSAETDPAIQVWVRRAIRGIGEQMMVVEQFQDARTVFLNYISRADLHDPELPEVYYLAADAARREGLAKNDPISFDAAIDTLQNLLDAFGRDQLAQATVHRARITLAELLFEASRFREAETQIKLIISANGGKSSDLFDFRLAECAFQDERPAQALPLFTTLWRNWSAGKADPQAPALIYVTSAYRVGQCHIAPPQPDYVKALFSFLRARQEFYDSPVDGELLINIARCYSELERDDDTINALWELLRSDTIADDRPGHLQLGQLLGELESTLTSYSGPVRAKALFYIAQADYRRALRDRRLRTTAAADAVHHYERALAENPPKELRFACLLGLARAALLGEQRDFGEKTLRSLIADRDISLRDRDYAANLLGTYLREQGRHREAIRAFQGESD